MHFLITITFRVKKKKKKKKRFTCWVQVRLKTSAMLSQTSFRADKDASALTLVKKRVILRTNLCHGDYLERNTKSDHLKY